MVNSVFLFLSIVDFCVSCLNVSDCELSLYLRNFLKYMYICYNLNKNVDI